MKPKLKKILRSIFLTSLGALGVSQTVDAVTNENDANLTNDNDSQLEKNKRNELSQKFVLKFNGDDSYLIAGHRSHRSHQSHRSHYSSSSGTSSSGTSSSRSSSSSSNGTSGYTLPSQNTIYKLGDRVLKCGMKGHDVTELLNILVSKKYIIPEEGTSKIATGEFEFTILIEEAIKKFQQDCSLKADGVVGPSTVHYLKK